MADVVAVERRDDGTAVVTLNRPQKLNAMDPALFRALIAAMDELDSDTAVSACVLTGAGRAFSAGGDIGSFAELRTRAQAEGIDAYRRHLRLVYDAFHAVERAAVPVIGAVNGIAYGGGTELALACDVVIASERARFAFREPTVGLMPGYGVVRGPDVIGRHWTRWLAFTGDVIDAGQAERIGLVQRVVAHERLLDEALAVAGRIRDNAPLGVRVAKQFINRGAGAPGLAESVEATALLFTTEEHARRVRSFLDG